MAALKLARVGSNHEIASICSVIGKFVPELAGVVIKLTLVTVPTRLTLAGVGSNRKLASVASVSVPKLTSITVSLDLAGTVINFRRVDVGSNREVSNIASVIGSFIRNLNGM